MVRLADFVLGVGPGHRGSQIQRRSVVIVRLHTTDTGARYDIGLSGSATVIHGSGSSLLAWLMGRSGGCDLAVHGTGALPEPPALF